MTTATTLVTTVPPSSTPTPLFHTARFPLLPQPFLPLSNRTFRRPPSRPIAITRCEVAVRSDSSVSISEEDAEVKSQLEKVGSRVRVKSPLKVYHVPRVPEVELTPEMEGVIKNYVGFWKGKRITASYPFKAEFTIDVEGRGAVKFVTHLREDEFDIIE